MFDKSKGTLIQCPGGKVGNYTVPDNVTNIAAEAFYSCTRLTNVTIPNSVATIGNQALSGCENLTGVYFQGNAPNLALYVFYWSKTSIVYFLPGTTGGSPTFGGRPTAPWFLPTPTILAFGPGFGVQTNRFGFRISWATNAAVVVEATTNLVTPTWSAVATNALADGWSDFSDSDWTNHPARFYRLRSP